MKKLNSILLIDDDKATNFICKMLFTKAGVANQIDIVLNGKQAIEYLKNNDTINQRPMLVFLDLNMPVMDGWEFAEEFEKLDAKQKSEIVIIIHTSSLNPDDKERGEKIASISGFENKILTMEGLKRIMNQFFPDYTN
jgi:CheY-like chemotaxis protein